MQSAEIALSFPTTGSMPVCGGSFFPNPECHLMAKKIELTVPCLPAGIFHDVTLYSRNNVVFAVYKGHVYVVGHSTLNLAAGWRMNDIIRRLWCKASGVKFVDLKLAIQAYKQAQETLQTSERFNDLKEQAARLGYSLRKVS